MSLFLELKGETRLQGIIEERKDREERKKGRKEERKEMETRVWRRNKKNEGQKNEGRRKGRGKLVSPCSSNWRER